MGCEPLERYECKCNKPMYWPNNNCTECGKPRKKEYILIVEDDEDIKVVKDNQ